MIPVSESKGGPRGTIALVALWFAGLCSCGNAVEYYSDGVRRAEGPLAIRSEKRIPTAIEREDGSWTWWYPNGERRESGSHAEGHRVGEWTQWYPNGQRRSRGERAWDPETNASPRVGAWTFWHQNGVIESSGRFERGLREGEWTAFHDTGEKLSEGSFVKGRREGLWTFRHLNGAIHSRGLFVNGLRQGHWDFTREDGWIDAENTGEYHLDARID